jgi:hypothetical protein
MVPDSYGYGCGYMSPIMEFEVLDGTEVLMDTTLLPNNLVENYAVH